MEDPLGGIDSSNTESGDAYTIEEDEEGETSTRKHSRSPSVELVSTPIPKKARTCTRRAIRKVSISSVLVSDVGKESEGTRQERPIAQGAGNPYSDYFLLKTSL